MKTIDDINNFISPDLQQQYNLEGDNLAMFMAQCDHESQGFTRLEENLNYSSADRLRKIFPKYFIVGHHNPNDYVNNPQGLANLVYSGRMGNKDIKSGNGYMYRGRGYLMITGRDMYSRCSKAIGYDLINAPSRIIDQPFIALKSALWIWQYLKLADCDIYQCTQKLNGGSNGIEDRIKKFEYYRGIIDNAWIKCT